MSLSRTQIEMNLQCNMELLGRLSVEKHFLGREWHKHPFFEVFYIVKGEFDVHLKDKKKCVKAGELFLIAPNVIHQFVSESGGELIYAGISLVMDQEAVYPEFIPCMDEALKRRMEHACELAEKKGNEALRRGASEIMPELCRVVLELQPIRFIEKGDALSEKIKQYLAVHVAENISIREIAAALYMNPHYLGEYFKKKNGVSIKNYLLDLRMQKAFILLKKGNCSITKIAEEVGFETVQYFSLKFKEYYGISPGNYFAEIKQIEK